MTAVFHTSAHCPRCGWARHYQSTTNPVLAADASITLAEQAVAQHMAGGKHLRKVGAA